MATLADHALADPNIDAKAVLRRFRSQLNARGVRGIVGLGEYSKILHSILNFNLNNIEI